MQFLILCLLVFLIFRSKIVNIVLNWYKLSFAASNIESFFRKYEWLLDANPSVEARRIVNQAWRGMPELLSGKIGGRPHVMTVAIYSLAFQLDTSKNDNCTNKKIVLLALGDAILFFQNYILTNGSLSSVDQALINESMLIYNNTIENDKSIKHYDEQYKKLKSIVS